MGEVIEFKRPERKKNWRGGKEYKYTAAQEQPGVSDAIKDLKDLESAAQPAPSKGIFEHIQRALGNSSLYNAYLKMITFNQLQARSEKTSSSTGWFMPRDFDLPCVTLTVNYDVGYTVKYDFMGRDDVEQIPAPRIGKPPVIDVSPPEWIKVHPYLILSLQDVLLSLDEFSSISILQDKTALRYSIVFNGYSRTRINATIEKTEL